MKLAEPSTVGVVLAIRWLCHQQYHHTFSRHISCWRYADIMTHTFPSSLLGNHSLIRHYSARYKAADTLPYHHEHFDNPSVLLCILFRAFKKHSQVGLCATCSPECRDTETLGTLESEREKLPHTLLPSHSRRQRGTSFCPHWLTAEEN